MFDLKLLQESIFKLLISVLDRGNDQKRYFNNFNIFKRDLCSLLDKKLPSYNNILLKQKNVKYVANYYKLRNRAAGNMKS